MATVTKPIALDESFNTTEVTPRNIADVLAEGLSHITGRTASEVEYDNTDSGLTADNVQDALDEIAESVPTLPTTDIQTAVDEFETYNGGLLSECKVALSPNQDLHGYAEPWVGGAGKNKFNGEYSYASASVYSPVNPSTIYTLSTKSTGAKQINYQYIYTDDSFGGDAKLCDAGATSGSVTITTPSNAKGIEIYAAGTPSQTASIASDTQLELGSSVTAYEPYENICPISGHTQVEVGDDGKNRLSGLEQGSLDTYGGTNPSTTRIRTKEFIKVDSATAYTFSSESSIQIYMLEFDEIGNERINSPSWVDLPVTFTTQPTTKYFKAMFRYSNNADITPTDAKNCQLELGSTATAYEPYNGYQLTINLGGTYYSGILDVVSGVFVPDTAEKILPSDGWLAEGENTGAYTNYSIKADSSYPELICSESVRATNYSDVFNNDHKIGLSTTRVIWHESTFADVTALMNYLSNNTVQIVHKLATPTPIQLSPTMVKALVGENNLSAPLEGQEITESKYRELFTWDEVEAYVNAHSGGGSGMNYSTEEQVVGTWIDGKPLYQRSISIAGVSIPTNQTVTIYTQANIKMKYFSGYLTENDTTYVIPEVGVRIRQSGDNIQISSQSGASWTISEGYVTIRYTKTTD